MLSTIVRQAKQVSF